jgi:hypothetical protein
MSGQALLGLLSGRKVDETLDTLAVIVGIAMVVVGAVLFFVNVRRLSRNLIGLLSRTSILRCAGMIQGSVKNGSSEAQAKVQDRRERET